MKIIDGITWHNVRFKMPEEKKLVMLTGDSGYLTHVKFLTLGYYDEEYRPSHGGETRWLDVQNEALLDQGWTPTHWAELIQLP